MNLFLFTTVLSYIPYLYDLSSLVYIVLSQEDMTIIQGLFWVQLYPYSSINTTEPESQIS
jgi:hypothetical protein